MSADQLNGKPCNIEGCGGSLKQSVAKGGKFEGQAYFACSNWQWHKANEADKTKKGPWILSSNAKAVGDYLRNLNSFAAGTTTASTLPAQAATGSASVAKRKAEYIAASDLCDDRILNVLIDIKKLQEQQLAIFTDFNKKLKNSSPEEEQAPQDE